MKIPFMSVFCIKYFAWIEMKMKQKTAIHINYQNNLAITREIA